jgi:hypothetical protein
MDQLDEATVSNIETDASIDGQLLELTINTLWTTMQAAFSPLDSINYELNSIDKNTRDNLKYLQKSLEDTNIGAINSDYNTVFSTIDMNLPLTMTNIRNAIAGMVKKSIESSWKIFKLSFCVEWRSSYQDSLGPASDRGGFRRQQTGRQQRKADIR